LLVHLLDHGVEYEDWIDRVTRVDRPEFVQVRRTFGAWNDRPFFDAHRLERDFICCDGDRHAIERYRNRATPSVLSNTLMRESSLTQPWELIGGICVVHGLVANMATHWIRLLRSVLGLVPEQMTFLHQHANFSEAYRDKLLTVLSTLPLCQDAIARIIAGALSTVSLSIQNLAEIDAALE